MIDRQQERVYEWEATWPRWSESNTSLPQLRRYVQVACKMYGLKPPTVKQHRHTHMSAYFPDHNAISFRVKEQKNCTVALHEAAHHIVWQIFSEGVEDHGREWLGVYLFLLETAGAAPRQALEVTAERFNLKWAPHSEISPSALKRAAGAHSVRSKRSSRV